jgi:hypothetical protein
MLRKLTIAFAAFAAIGVAAIPTGASAAWHGHGWHHDRGYYGGPYLAGAWPYYGCRQMRLVPTPAGPRWRRVWVCG